MTAPAFRYAHPDHYRGRPEDYWRALRRAALHESRRLRTEIRRARAADDRRAGARRWPATDLVLFVDPSRRWRDPAHDSGPRGDSSRFTLTADEIADRLGVRESAVRAWVYRGHLLTETEADRFAVRLGVNPAAIWPTWYGGPVALDDCDTGGVESVA